MRRASTCLRGRSAVRRASQVGFCAVVVSAWAEGEGKGIKKRGEEGRGRKKEGGGNTPGTFAAKRDVDGERPPL
jgi:hypothetical protein